MKWLLKQRKKVKRNNYEHTNRTPNYPTYRRPNRRDDPTINDILERPEIDLLKNANVKEGYDLAADILVEDLREVKDVDFSKVKSVQGRAIGFLAVDYLNGEISQEVLVGVGLKK